MTASDVNVQSASAVSLAMKVRLMMTSQRYLGDAVLHIQLLLAVGPTANQSCRPYTCGGLYANDSGHNNRYNG